MPGAVKILVSIRYTDPSEGPASVERECEFPAVPAVGDYVEMIAGTGWDERVESRYFHLDGTVAVCTAYTSVTSEELDDLRRAGFRPAGEA